ncbi:MAG: Nif3-like dinuclear metal center hexameric protein [Bacteroidetes bacterium]|jgi:dinuclear metal center YbgI/SA1388 family protein|nr:Nif3-like dinuclear metal center hexameric protein [Bacteroidota bacterium]
MKIHDIISEIENFAPLAYQEDYDNCGLITGDRNAEASGVLLSLDCIESVVDEAIENKCNLIIAHHPILFSGLKKITGSNYIERTIIKAIKNDIAIYAAHTNVDNVINGVNYKIAEKLGLVNLKILAPKADLLRKLVTYVPESHHQSVLDALFKAGCGHIGNYDHCSFNTNGTGTFRGNENSDPFLGKPGELSREAEIKIETVFEGSKESSVLTALIEAHPYEEVAYDVYRLSTRFNKVGSGLIGELKNGLEEDQFLALVKKSLQSECLKFTKKTGKIVKKVALCGGSGRFLLKNAINSKSDAFITSDFKYHEFFDAEGKILLIDAGHYETEQFTPEIFYDIIRKKFPTFAIRLSKIKTNPVNYFL